VPTKCFHVWYWIWLVLTEFLCRLFLSLIFSRAIDYFWLSVSVWGWTLPYAFCIAPRRIVKSSRTTACQDWEAQAAFAVCGLIRKSEIYVVGHRRCNMHGLCPSCDIYHSIPYSTLAEKDQSVLFLITRTLAADTHTHTHTHRGCYAELCGIAWW